MKILHSPIIATLPAPTVLFDGAFGDLALRTQGLHYSGYQVTVAHGQRKNMTKGDDDDNAVFSSLQETDKNVPRNSFPNPDSEWSSLTLKECSNILDQHYPIQIFELL